MTYKPEQESKWEKIKVKYPCIIRKLRQCKLTSHSGYLNGAGAATENKMRLGFFRIPSPNNNNKGGVNKY